VLITSGISYLININFHISAFIEFILAGIISIIIPNLIILIIFRKTDEFKYFINLVFSKFKIRRD